MNVITEYLSNSDNVTFLIAVVGFLMSIWNFGRDIWNNWVRLKISVEHTTRFWKPRRCQDILHLKIYNLSSKPVVISRIEVSNYLGTASFGSYKREIITKIVKDNDGNIQTSWYSDMLPIKIEGNGCANLLIESDSDSPAIGEHGPNTITLYTPQRRFTANLPTDHALPYELLLQCREPN